MKSEKCTLTRYQLSLVKEYGFSSFSVAHHIYGVASTINSANYVYFLALQKILVLGDPRSSSIFTEQLLELHRGQGMEIHWRDSYKCPTEEEYRTMVIQSNSKMFISASRSLMRTARNLDANLLDIVENHNRVPSEIVQ